MALDRRLLPRALAAALLVAVTTQFGLHRAEAQQIGDVGQGKELATQWCAECHMVQPGARRAGDFAPPFAEIAGDAKTTEFRLRAFLQTPHDRMPDYRLSRDQTDNLIGYILSLKRR